MSTSVPAAWSALVDDAAIFPPGDRPLPEAVAAHVARREEWYADLIGPFVVRDEQVPSLDEALPVSIVVTGGAGAIAGALRLAGKASCPVAGIEVALRDPDDPVGAARRVAAAVDAARSDGALGEETPVHVELPHVANTNAWLSAADVVAAEELRLKFRTGGLQAEAYPAAHALARWIDAALDRETPFKCTAGLHNAVRHTGADGFEHHGFLNVLLATRVAFDGGDTGEVVDVLEQRDGDALVRLWQELGEDTMARTRRWFTSFGSCSVDEPRDDLISLGLLEAP